MNKWMLTCGLAAVVTLGSLQSASAQPPSPARRPTVTPYLELLRNNRDGGGLGFDYFRRLRPAQDLQRRLNSQSQEMRSLQGQLQAVEEFNRSLQERDRQLLGTTGHPTQFMSTGGYFSGVR